MTLYELNKENYIRQPTLTHEKLLKLKPFIISFLDETKSKYYLLLNYTQRHYTFFTFPNKNYNPGELVNQLIELIEGIGEVKAIEKSGLGNMLEIWIKDNSGECDMYGLFDYSGGVIEIE